MAHHPGLPIKPGRCQTMTHDHKRHGTTTLFAALSVLDGTVIGRFMQRHRHSEFIRLLNAVEREVPAGKLIHTVLKLRHSQTPQNAGLAVAPSQLDLPLHPDLGLVAQRGRELLFQNDPPTHPPRRSIADLQPAINAYLAEHNTNAKPFVWTKSADAILAKLDRLPVPSV
jgi:hypothetical protein